VRGCSRGISHPVCALQQRKRCRHLRPRERSAVPTAERTLEQTNPPGKVRIEQTRQIGQRSSIPVGPNSKFCAAWYSSLFLIFGRVLHARTCDYLCPPPPCPPPRAL